MKEQFTSLLHLKIVALLFFGGHISTFAQDCTTDTDAPIFGDNTAFVLFSEDYENPNSLPGADCYLDLNINPNVNSLYGPGYLQFFTVETMLINGPSNLYTDPTGTGGDYSLGMFSTLQNDRLAFEFNTQGKSFLNLQMDLSAIAISACGNQAPIVTNGIPTMRLQLYDNPTGSFTFNNLGTLLSQADVTGVNPAGDYTFNWTQVIAGLDASAATNGDVVLLFDLLTSPYASFDNLEVSASDVSIVNDCPASVSILCAGDVPAPVTPTVTDNCDANPTIAFIETEVASNANDKVITRTWTAMDATGNSSECVQTITIEDTELPTAACQAHTATLDAAGSATITAADIDGGSDDVCGFSLSASPLTFDCGDIGENTVTLTITDNSGNTANCDATVTITDNIAPTIVCAAINPVVFTGSSCLYQGSPGTLDIDDNCNGSLTLLENFYNAAGNNYLSLQFSAMGGDNAGGIGAGRSLPVGLNTVILTVIDEYGLSGSCSFTIEVQDNTNPTPICQDVTINLEGTTSITTADINNGSSDVCGIASMSLSMTDFECANIGNNMVTLTVTDVNGNSNTCNANVTVEAAAPIISCPADIVQSSDATICGAIVDYLVTATSANPITDLDGFTYLGSTPDGNQYFLSDAAMDWSEAKIDAAANGGHLVTIDNAATNALVSGNQIHWIGLTDEVTEGQMNWITGEPLTYTNWGDNGIGITEPDDFSPDPNISQDYGITNWLGAGLWGDTFDDFTSRYILELEGGIQLIETTGNYGTHSEFPVGTTNVCYQAIDNCGLMDECCFDVTIIDNTLPTPICQDALVVLDDAGNGSITTTDIDNGSNDACGVANLSLEIETFDCTNIGNNAVMMRVTDSYGNIGECTANVEVQDNTDPTPICQDASVILDDAGNGSITTTDIDNGSNDACGIANLSLDITTFTCANVGNNTVTLTVTDNNQNSNTCTANVEVEDNTNPTPVCQDITTQLDVDGNANISPEQIDNGSNDICSIALLSLDNQSFTCNSIGNNTVTLTVTDVNDNSATCTAIVNVEDNVAPEVITQDITVELDNEGNVSISPDQVNNGTNDACGIASLSLNITQFSCGNVGPNTVILSATDVNGNTNTETAIVTVLDLLPAEITCRQPISTTVTPGQCQRENLTVLPPFVLYDNCGIDSGIDISRTPAGNDFAVGTTTLVWTITDSNGNPAQCESLVIVQDNEPPSVNSCTTSVDFLDPGSCMANVSIDVNAQDECGIASVEGDGEFLLPIGIHPQTITITDVNGNQTVHLVTVYVHDDQAPIVALCPQDMTVESSSIPTPVNLTEPQFSDNCGIFSIENDAPDAFPLGTTLVTYTASDEYGNTVDCSYNVNVVSGVSFDNTIEGIEASAPTAEAVSWVDWNRPQTRTSCETCAETDYPDYLYLGDFNGHQYFLFAGAVNWSEASILSSEMNGHLVSLNDKEENAFLQNLLPTTPIDEEAAIYWTGLNDSSTEIAWENGDAFEYINFPYDIALDPEALNATIFNTDGTWTMTNGENEAGFIMERPCIELVQTAPLIEVNSEEGDTTQVLLTPDSQWATGTYTVTYEAIDLCENTASYSFDVHIAEEDAEYCNTGGTQHDVWVKRVIIEDYLMETEEAASYTDNTAEMIALSETNTVAIQLTPGGIDLTSNTDLLYWRIWLDLNNDGDFFDANEQIYETSSTSIVNLEMPISANLFGQTLRSRISVATQQYPEACLEFAEGEAEDYTLVFPEMPEEAGRSAGNFNLSPNPADNYANIFFNDLRGENVVVTLYDNLGKVRLETKAQIELGEPIRLDLRTFIDGIYFVRVQVEGKRMMTKRLVVDKFYGWRPAR